MATDVGPYNTLYCQEQPQLVRCRETLADRKERAWFNTDYSKLMLYIIQQMPKNALAKSTSGCKLIT